ncbi:hypothetical protein GCM10029963_02820 [Micromonospora andamanensis]
MVRIDLVSLIVEEYDPAIAFFTDVLGFDLVEDSPSLTDDGRPKRWVVVRPRMPRPDFCSRAPTENTSVPLSATR